MIDSQTIVVDEVFPHTAEVIWNALTSGELMALWLMPPSGFQAVEGNRFTFKTTPAGAWDGLIHCQILEIIPLTRFVYSWKGGDENNIGYGSKLDTTVTWSLTPGEGGTRVRLVHAGFILPENATALNNMGEGWKKILPQLDAIASESAGAK